MRALAHQPARRLVLLRKLQGIRLAIFGATAFTCTRSRRVGCLVGIVAEFGGHGNDASTEEKRAARNRPSQKYPGAPSRFSERRIAARDRAVCASAPKFQSA